MPSFRQSLKVRVSLFSCVSVLTVAFFPAMAQAQELYDRDALSGVYPGAPYSPYAQRDYPDQVLWGDTHLHTRLSADAGLFGNTLGLDDAYRFARGEEVVSSTGQPVRLGRPLDWLVIADHSDAMGFSDDMATGAPRLMAFEQARGWYEGLQQGGMAATDAAVNLITNFAQGTLQEGMLDEYSPGSATYAAVWDKVIETAERYNDPGTFTTIIGFEWTSLIAGNNLHRNVLFRDGADRVGQVVPYTTQPPVGSPNPLDLYAYLENYEAATGGQAFAIAHNGNLSNGMMFPVDFQYTGEAVDANYVQLRNRWEPLYEVTQIKGDGETHPMLSPDDAFANFEIWDAGNLDMSQAKTPEMLGTEYARQALMNGLMLEEQLGTNPYKFGMVGSTDAHTSLSAVEEDNFFGKTVSSEPSPERMQGAFVRTEQGAFMDYQLSAGGYTGVWANENTREAIWDAMSRKETYATTGPRMIVRLFGGWDFTAVDLGSRELARIGYARGVPMGGDLRPRQGDGAPSFMVYALRDPVGANLDRIQIVKGWVTTDGTTQERVYDVAWDAARTPDANGVLPPVGNTVDIANAGWLNTIGSSELGTVWTDPDFDPALPAFYYARVIEIPTPRWVVYDAKRFGVPIPPEAETSHQERAYTSPIWYNPGG